jgi:hypothetical protein
MGTETITGCGFTKVRLKDCTPLSGGSRPWRVKDWCPTQGAGDATRMRTIEAGSEGEGLLVLYTKNAEGSDQFVVVVAVVFPNLFDDDAVAKMRKSSCEALQELDAYNGQHRFVNACDACKEAVATLPKDSCASSTVGHKYDSNAGIVSADGKYHGGCVFANSRGPRKHLHATTHEYRYSGRDT